MEYTVCHQSELGPGQKKLVRTEQNIPIVVLCSEKDKQYYAVRATCPHQGACLAYGKLTWDTVEMDVVYGVERDGEILRCPWHGFDFDVKTGACLADSERYRVKTYAVQIQNGNVVVMV